MKISFKILALIIFIILLSSQKLIALEKIKIGLLVPLTGNNSDVGKSIIQSVRMAINKIDNPNFEILPKDTKDDPLETLKAAEELQNENIKIVIGPVFNKNLIYLEKLNNMIFLSLTNKTIDNPKNIISAGINAESQLKSIIKFQKQKKLKKTIFLMPKSNYQNEVVEAISKTKIKIKNFYNYDIDPTKLTKQIEEITKYKERKLALKREIKKLENSNLSNKKSKIEKLKTKDTIGSVNFDSVIIADFDESLKSITTSLLYTDVYPQDIYFITLNQWFDSSLLKEKSSQPLYFPSVNFNNYKNFSKEYFSNFKTYPTQLSIVSYDLLGLVYYLIYENNFIIDEKLFIRKNKFKGKVGIFEINKNKINHVLNFYEIKENEFKKIF